MSLLLWTRCGSHVPQDEPWTHIVQAIEPLAAHSANLVLVTYDLDTIPGILHRWLAENRSIAGVSLIPARTIAQNDIGGIVRAVVRLYDEPAMLDPAYPVVYLQPSR